MSTKSVEVDTVATCHADGALDGLPELLLIGAGTLFLPELFRALPAGGAFSLGPKGLNYSREAERAKKSVKTDAQAFDEIAEQDD
jgi:hypothetical protein